MISRFDHHRSAKEFRRCPDPVRFREAFTLFEVILAIALSATLLALIGAAIHIYLYTTDTSRSEVEESQLARAILQRIATDLRAAIRYQPQDTSTAMSLAKETAAFDVESLDTPTETESASSANEDIANSTELPPVPGVFGNAYELQVDISRVPRIDEYEVMFDSEKRLLDRPSDIKTVAYYLREGRSITASSLAATRLREDRQTVAGLIRRQLDRATTQYAIDTGDASLLDERGELFAPEVVRLEFQYFNGTEWLTEWNSDEEGGLPCAIHVRIWMRKMREEESPETGILRLSQQPNENDSMYELIVHLPNAEPITDDSTSSGIE
ncbi:MAG: hypothetical protein JW829_19880 [Pirellulales bacterium]|nr:hypothetical protein [Pirellulales bacterium]